MGEQHVLYLVLYLIPYGQSELLSTGVEEWLTVSVTRKARCEERVGAIFASSFALAENVRVKVVSDLFTISA